ncbi:MAG: hypothetical protein OHK0023_24740 [Anaerolineae bacterium]
MKLITRLIPLIVVAGALAALVSIATTGNIPGVRPQTSNPNASTLYMTGEQGIIFLLWISLLIIGPLVTFTALISLLMWWGNRQVNRAAKENAQPLSFSLNPAKPRTLGYILVHSPGLTIFLLVVLLVGGAVFLALTGAFTPR